MGCVRAGFEGPSRLPPPAVAGGFPIPTTPGVLSSSGGPTSRSSGCSSPALHSTNPPSALAARAPSAAPDARWLLRTATLGDVSASAPLRSAPLPCLARRSFLEASLSSCAPLERGQLLAQMIPWRAGACPQADRAPLRAREDSPAARSGKPMRGWVFVAALPRSGQAEACRPPEWAPEGVELFGQGHPACVHLLSLPDHRCRMQSSRSNELLCGRSSVALSPPLPSPPLPSPPRRTRTRQLTASALGPECGGPAASALGSRPKPRALSSGTVEMTHGVPAAWRTVAPAAKPG